MVQNKTNKHIFSFYCPDVIFPAWVQGATVSIFNADLVHRLVKVVKVHDGDLCVLFDKHMRATVTILETTKKDIKIRVESLHSNHVMQPHLIFLLPLLKKEALEEAVYSLCEIGVNEIQLVATAKSKALSAVTSKELDRLRAIIIAAAEQSKNYAFSTLLEPKKIQDVIPSLAQASQKIVFDVSGQSFFEIHKKIAGKNMVLSVGPEGGLTDEELTFLQSHGFESCALTQTILRAVQAVAIGSALLRLF